MCKSLHHVINDFDPILTEFTIKVGRQPHKYIQYEVTKDQIKNYQHQKNISLIRMLCYRRSEFQLNLERWVGLNVFRDFGERLTRYMS